MTNMHTCQDASELIKSSMEQHDVAAVKHNYIPSFSHVDKIDSFSRLLIISFILSFPRLILCVL